MFPSPLLAGDCDNGLVFCVYIYIYIYYTYIYIYIWLLFCPVQCSQGVAKNIIRFHIPEPKVHVFFRFAFCAALDAAFPETKIGQAKIPLLRGFTRCPTCADEEIRGHCPASCFAYTSGSLQSE